MIMKIAGDLLDLVGDSAFEIVQELLLVRDPVLLLVGTPYNALAHVLKSNNLIFMFFNVYPESRF